jgi:hypothetical protein
MIFGVLRDTNGQPLSTAVIVRGILRAGEHDEAARAAAAPRVLRKPWIPTSEGKGR